MYSQLMIRTTVVYLMDPKAPKNSHIQQRATHFCAQRGRTETISFIQKKIKTTSRPHSLHLTPLSLPPELCPLGSGEWGVQNPGHYTQAHVGVFNYPEHTVVPKGLRHLGPMGPLETGGTDMYPAKTPRGNWLGSEGLISATRIQMPGKTSGRKTSFEKLNLPSNKAEKRTSLAKKQKHCTKGSRKSRKCINPTEEQDLTSQTGIYKGGQKMTNTIANSDLPKTDRELTPRKSTPSAPAKSLNMIMKWNINGIDSNCHKRTNMSSCTPDTWCHCYIHQSPTSHEIHNSCQHIIHFKVFKIISLFSCLYAVNHRDDKLIVNIMMINLLINNIVVYKLIYDPLNNINNCFDQICFSLTKIIVCYNCVKYSIIIIPLIISSGLHLKNLEQIEYACFDMQHAPAKLPSKVHIFEYVDVLAQSLCSLATGLTCIIHHHPHCLLWLILSTTLKALNNTVTLSQFSLIQVEKSSTVYTVADYFKFTNLYRNTCPKPLINTHSKNKCLCFTWSVAWRLKIGCLASIFTLELYIPIPHAQTNPPFNLEITTVNQRLWKCIETSWITTYWTFDSDPLHSFITTSLERKPRTELESAVFGVPPFKKENTHTHSAVVAYFTLYKFIVFCFSGRKSYAKPQKSVLPTFPYFFHILLAKDFLILKDEEIYILCCDNTQTSRRRLFSMSPLSLPFIWQKSQKSQVVPCNNTLEVVGGKTPTNFELCPSDLQSTTILCLSTILEFPRIHTICSAPTNLVVHFYNLYPLTQKMPHILAKLLKILTEIYIKKSVPKNKNWLKEIRNKQISKPSLQKNLTQQPAVDLQKVPGSFCCYSNLSP
ncbi:hypothetical protein VP01_3413g1 [Puccinia sorghi]|uniref:Uncharacterized protein n=1 Tax=Puccinia sorghi TaxID=27349 RepID=A0A0L6UWL0_9BASI|nr:hypothetical protein VP01_3413g1 [Puccinia sorghi]